MEDAQRPDIPTVQGPETQKGKRRRNIIISLVAAVLALGGAGLYTANLSAQAEQQAETAAASASASAAAAAKQKADDAALLARVTRARLSNDAQEAKKAEEMEQARTESEIKQMEAQGWTSAGSQMYFKYLDHSKFTCGSWKCTYLDVVSMALNGCPGGIYVAVSIDRGEGSIGSTNEITAGLPNGKVARVKLEDTSNQGDGFQITKMNCHS